MSTSIYKELADARIKSFMAQIGHIRRQRREPVAPVTSLSFRRGKRVRRDDGKEYPTIRAAAYNGRDSEWNARRIALQSAIHNGRDYEGHYYQFVESHLS